MVTAMLLWQFAFEHGYKTSCLQVYKTVGKQNIGMIAYKSFKYTYNPLQTTFSIIIRYVEWFVGWTVVIWCPYHVPSFFAVLLSLHLHLAMFFSSCHVFAAGAYLSWCLPLQSSRSLSSFNKCIFYPTGALIIFLSNSAILSAIICFIAKWSLMAHVNKWRKWHPTLQSCEKR